jgi:hypothetical protein
MLEKHCLLAAVAIANDDFIKTCEIHLCSIFFTLRIQESCLLSSTQLASPSQLPFLGREEMLDYF